MFLTIADTVHDFGDLNRYPISSATDSLDKRRVLKERIIATLVEEIYDAAKNEMLIINSHPECDQVQRLLPMYDSFFKGGLNIPHIIGNEDAICDIIKKSLEAFGCDYFEEGDHYKRIVIDRAETTPELLYEQFSNMSGKRFVKYVLDKNQTDDALFCVDPDIINLTTNASKIVRGVKPFIFKSRYKGLFDDFDNNRNRVSQTGVQSEAIKHTADCNHKDHVEYVIRKDDCETLELTEIGVKTLPSYKLLYSYEDAMDVPITFLNRQSHRGLALFNRAVIELDSIELSTLQHTALRVIDQVFSLRCDRYADLYDSPSNRRIVSVKWACPTRFPKALYDLKRAMDYLPVKATKNANLAFSQHDIQYFYISSDRLAIAYALLQGCPCVLVEKGGTTFHVYNIKGVWMTGGYAISHASSSVRAPDKESHERTDEDLFGYTEYMRMPLQDLLPEGDPQEGFETFLVEYMRAFRETHIDYFWYVTYRFLFFFL
jgi:hypothetical protein